MEEPLAESGLPVLDPTLSGRFATYLSLILRWNKRLNLTAIRDEEDILRRHFVESIFCARALPAGIRTLLDFGSGAGFPGLPIALCRPEITVTLSESNGKKAALLKEAVRTVGIGSRVHAGRAETLSETFNCVVLRAVDRMERATEAGARLVAPAGWLALMTTSGDLAKLQAVAGEAYCWNELLKLPGSEERVLALGRRVSSQA
jgi:16S rRNA (guanine527-N7)-methyltransferase